MKFDWSQAAAFLDALAPGQSIFVFQTFMDNNERLPLDPLTGERVKRDPVAKVLVGTLEDVMPRLATLAERGAGIFVQINDVDYGKPVQRGKKFIKRIRALWVDDDSGQDSALHALKQRRMPKPSIIVQSSPGKAHYYWRMDDVPIEQFGVLQKQLAKTFGTDKNVHNLDRVMRLPGTWNQKVSKLEPVRLVSSSNQVYIQSEVTGPTLVATSTAPSSLISTSEGYQLPSSLPPGDRTQHLIQYAGHLVGQNFSEEYIKKAVVEAAEKLCPPGAPKMLLSDIEREIFPAIKRWRASAVGSPIAEHEVQVAACGAGNFNSDVADGGTLDRYLSQYIYIEAGPAVADREAHPTEAVYSLIEFKARNTYHRVKVSDKQKIYMSFLWQHSPARVSVRNTKYVPVKDRIVKANGHSYFNTFVGANIEPPEQVDMTRVDAFTGHVNFLFNNDADAVKRFLDWVAFSIQRPLIRIPWSPLIVTRPGMGKGWLLAVLKGLVGEHNFATIGPDDIETTFNEYMYGSLFVCVDELKTSQRFNIMERLKPLISEPRLLVNRKYGGKNQERIFCNFICFSNHIDAAALTADDRRFWVWHTKGHPKGASYYTKLFDWVEQSANIAHLNKFLMDRDLSGFKHAEPPPMTKAKSRMIVLGRSNIEEVIRDGISDRDGIFQGDILSLELVETFVKGRLNTDNLTGRDKYILGRVFNELTGSLQHDRYRIDIGETRRRYRLRAVRNFPTWEHVEAADIRREFSIAMATSLGRKPAEHLSGVPSAYE